VYVISFVLMSAFLCWLAPVTELWMLYLFAIVFGFAYGGLATANSPLVAWLFGMRQHWLIFGVCFNGWTLGCAIGPIVAGGGMAEWSMADTFITANLPRTR
jgi:MFS family permease